MKPEHAHVAGGIVAAVDGTSAAAAVAGVAADDIALVVKDLLPYVEEDEHMRLGEVPLADIRLLEVVVGPSGLVEVFDILDRLPVRLAHKQHDRDC